MTATRIARAGRIRFFIILGTLVLTMGLVAMFHSSQQQLDASRRMEIRCEQQQDALSSQIEVLETKLKAERQHYDQLRQTLEREAREQTQIKERTVQEINLKYESLQQQYKFLNSQLEDNKEECTRDRTKLSKDIADYQIKVKSLQSQAIEKDNSLEQWKTKYNLLLQEKQTLESAQGSSSPVVAGLRQEIANYKEHCAWRPVITDTIVGPTPLPPGSSSAAAQPEKSFNAQIPVGRYLYEIPIKQTNQNGDGLQPQQQQLQQQKTLIPPANMPKIKSGSIINSVENFQLIPKPLAINDPLAKPSTPSTDRRTSDASGVNVVGGGGGGGGDKVNVAPNAPMPEPMRASTSTQASLKRVDDMGTVKKHPKPLPQGVVPFQTNVDDISAKVSDAAVASDADKLTNNNRYQNAIEDIGAAGVKNANALKDLQNGNGDNDMGAHEENDSNDFVMDERNHHGHLGENNKADAAAHNNNAAEEDLNLYDNGNRVNGAKVEKSAVAGNAADEDLQVIHQSDNEHDNRNADDDVKEQAKHDQGEAYPDDRLGELPEDGDGDDDEYPERNQGRDIHPAIRERR